MSNLVMSILDYQNSVELVMTNYKPFRDDTLAMIKSKLFLEHGNTYLPQFVMLYATSDSHEELLDNKDMLFSGKIYYKSKLDPRYINVYINDPEISTYDRQYMSALINNEPLDSYLMDIERQRKQASSLIKEQKGYSLYSTVLQKEYIAPTEYVERIEYVVQGTEDGSSIFDLEKLFQLFKLDPYFQLCSFNKEYHMYKDLTRDETKPFFQDQSIVFPTSSNEVIFYIQIEPLLKTALLYVSANGTMRLVFNFDIISKTSIDESKKIINDTVVNFVHHVDEMNIYAKGKALHTNGKYNIVSLTYFSNVYVKIDKKLIGAIASVPFNIAFTSEMSLDKTVHIRYKPLQYASLQIDTVPFLPQSTIVRIKLDNVSTKLNDIRITLLLYLSFMFQVYEQKYKLSVQAETNTDLAIQRKIKELYYKVDSRNCQREDQPNVVLNPPNTNNTESMLNYKGIMLTCALNKQKPFIGFTNKNIPCCFMVDQRTNYKYIRNTKTPEELEIMVQASNEHVTINGINYNILKLKTGEDQPIYYYLDGLSNFRLIPDQEQIKSMQIEWLPVRFLEELKNYTGADSCTKKPELNEDMSQRCPDNGAATKYSFGYNEQGFPCCISSKKKSANVKQAYEIKKFDEFLDPERIGSLPPILADIFKNGKRLGVVTQTLIHCILRALNYTIGTKQVYTIKEFKKLVPVSSSNWSETYMRIMDRCQVNLIVLVRKSIDQSALDILCPTFISPNLPFVCVIMTKGENMNYFELIVHQTTTLKTNTLEMLWSNIQLDSFIKYIESHCVNEFKPPQNYEFKPAQPLHKLKGAIQLVNPDGSVSFVEMNNVIVPIREEKHALVNLASKPMYMLDIKNIKYYEDVKPKITLLKYIVCKNNIVGVLTDTGIIVPIKPADLHSPKLKLPLAESCFEWKGEQELTNYAFSYHDIYQTTLETYKQILAQHVRTGQVPKFPVIHEVSIIRDWIQEIIPDVSQLLLDDLTLFIIQDSTGSIENGTFIPIHIDDQVVVIKSIEDYKVWEMNKMPALIS